MTKGVKQLLAEANAAIDTISIEEARERLGSDDTVFIDVREASERAKSYIPGSTYAPRGFLEFIADPDAPMHDPVFSSGKRLVVYCASGARSALAAKALTDMGIANVANLVGGITAWVQSGAKTETPAGG